MEMPAAKGNKEKSTLESSSIFLFKLRMEAVVLSIMVESATSPLQSILSIIINPFVRVSRWRRRSCLLRPTLSSIVQS